MRSETSPSPPLPRHDQPRQRVEIVGYSVGRLTSLPRSGMSRHMTERTTVRLPEGLLARARRKAAAEGRTLTSLIEEGLGRVVTEPTQPARRRKMPRISKAVGGLLPGVDLSNNAARQELDDLAYMERMKRSA